MVSLFLATWRLEERRKAPPPTPSSEEEGAFTLNCSTLPCRANQAWLKPSVAVRQAGDNPEGSRTLMDTTTTDQVLRQILSDVLGLDSRQVAGFTVGTGLFGHLPELDSMAVAGLLTEIEDRLDIVIDDDDVDGELLDNYGSLLRFVKAKRETA